MIKQQEAKTTEEITLFRGRGCSQCNDTGYMGRIGIFEVMKFNEKIGKLVMEHKSASNIEEVAIADGMITMLQDGFMKALEGVTTIEEVLRVVN
jgi:general secretion pathway protein E